MLFLILINAELAFAFNFLWLSQAKGCGVAERIVFYLFILPSFITSALRLKAKVSKKKLPFLLA